MNESNADLVRLGTKNLFKTDGYVSYLEHKLEFSGNFDESNTPIFEWCRTKSSAPKVLPTPGQRFAGDWLPHDDIPFIVLDTFDLRLAFPVARSIHRDLSTPYPPMSLLIEAKEVNDPENDRKAAWCIYEYENLAITRCLTPEIEEAILRYGSGDANLSVPSAVALKYIGNEMRLLTEQRRWINPNGERELSLASARVNASNQILGEYYRSAALEERVTGGVLRSIGSELPTADATRFAELETMLAEMADIQKRRPEVFERSQQAASHPLTQELIAHTAQKLIDKDNALAHRLLRTEDMLWVCITQITKTRNSLQSVPVMKPICGQTEQANVERAATRSGNAAKSVQTNRSRLRI